MPRRKPTIRQNPTTAQDRPGTEWCPVHGGYHPSPEATYLQREATAPDVEPGKARAMLDRATTLKRRCPECGEHAPTLLEWATRIRQQLQQPATRFQMPPRSIVDPDTSEVGH